MAVGRVVLTLAVFVAGTEVVNTIDGEQDQTDDDVDGDDGGGGDENVPDASAEFAFSLVAEHAGHPLGDFLDASAEGGRGLLGGSVAFHCE